MHEDADVTPTSRIFLSEPARCSPYMLGRSIWPCHHNSNEPAINKPKEEVLN